MSRVGDKLTITVVAVPELGCYDPDEVCRECAFYSLESCKDMGCSKDEHGNGEAVLFVPEADAERYIVRAMERRMR